MNRRGDPARTTTMPRQRFRTFHTSQMSQPVQNLCHPIVLLSPSVIRRGTRHTGGECDSRIKLEEIGGIGGTEQPSYMQFMPIQNDKANSNHSPVLLQQNCRYRWLDRLHTLSQCGLREQHHDVAEEEKKTPLKTENP